MPILPRMRPRNRLAASFLSSALAALLAAQEPTKPERGTIIDDTELCLDVGTWWDLQRDRFLPPPAARTPPDAAFVAARVQPALRQALGDPAGGTDLVVCCLLALGQVARDVPDERLVDDVRRLLRHPAQEVREVAALALGIAGRDGEAELGLLAQLVRGEPALGPEPGAPPALRTRAFAAHGLGQLASVCPSLATQRAVWKSLSGLLATATEVDLRVAAVHAAGLLRLPFGDENAEKLRGEVVQALSAVWTARDGAPQDLSACACPIAIGKLLSRDHARSAEFAARCLAELARARPVVLGEPSLAQSSAIALGLLLRADDGEGLVGLGEAATRHPDLNARFFARMALGEIGGRRAEQMLFELLRCEDEAYATYADSWTVLALGVALRRADATAADRAALAKAFGAARNVPQRSRGLWSRLLAAGLAGCSAFVAEAAADLEARGGDPEYVAAAYCEALHLLGQRDGIGPLRALLRTADRRPELCGAAATALIALGERDLALRSVDEAAASQGLAMSNARFRAAATTSSPELLEAMLRHLGDPQRTPLQRAFAALAIGRAACQTAEPWSVRLMAHFNHIERSMLSNNIDGVLDLR